MSHPAFDKLFSLEGHVAVVTGGGGAIGRDTAAMLADAGAAVVLLDRDADTVRAAADAIAARGARVLAIVCDITHGDEVNAAFARIVQIYGRLDLLVNNAAMVKRVPALEMSVQAWREVMQVNLDAAFVCACAAARLMTAGGSIVNIASIMGLSGGGVYPIASYHASKGGLVNLTRALAVEWAQLNIRVNAVAPTWVRTEFTKALLDDPVMSAELLALMPIKQFAETTDVAAAVLYLAAPAARMVTGHVLAVDGGFLAR
ncbi:SDR family NAD(P)-dependent oxidoreductase [soil metagenome]